MEKMKIKAMEYNYIKMNSIINFKIKRAKL